MGKLQVLEVLLAGNQEVYKPGDVVQGEARIVVSEVKGDIRGIKVKCVGKALTQWTESEGSGDSQTTVTYTTTYEYFRQEITLRGAGNENTSSNRITLPAGEHRFPFQFQLPDTYMPPPFEGTYGHVRYYVKIAIDRPWKFDHHTQRLFSIFTVKDLNYELNVMVPPSHQVEKIVCCLCCASGPIVLKGHLDKRGYVPGEYIFVSLDLHNNSSRRIIDITVKLQQKGHYSAQRNGTGRTHHQQAVVTVAELKLAGCEAMGTVNYDRMKMLIPPIPPCCYENCPNIQLEYFVEIEGDVSGTPSDAHIYLPIVIGTIPAFQHTLKDPSVEPIQGQLPPEQPGVPPQGQHGYPQVGQPGVPPQGQQGYPPQGQAGAPPPGQQGYPPPGQPGAPPAGAGQARYPLPGQPGSAGYPLPGGLPGEEGLPPPPTYMPAVGGPKKIAGKKGSFGNVLFAPLYPCYDPDTLYASIGIPQGASSSSADGQQPAPTFMQPMSIQQLPHQS